MKKQLFDAVPILFAALTGCCMTGWMSQAVAQQIDTARGADIFATHCSECHSLKEGKDKKGPSLFHVFGAKAAQRDSFSYSDAMHNSQLVWNAESLAGYLTNPKKFLPGGKMRYDGLESAAERANLIAFLAAEAKR